MKHIPRPLKIGLVAAVAVLGVLTSMHILGIGDAGQIFEDIITLLILFFA